MGFLTELSADGSDAALFHRPRRPWATSAISRWTTSGAVYATLIGVEGLIAFSSSIPRRTWSDLAQRLSSSVDRHLLGSRSTTSARPTSPARRTVTGFEPKNALFPTLPPDPVDPTFTRHGFVAKLSAAGEVMFATLLGGSSQRLRRRVSRSIRAGEIYVGRHDHFARYPVARRYSTRRTIQRATLRRRSSSSSPMTAASFSTAPYLGGTSQDTLSGLGVDALGRIYVAGTTLSSDLP